MSGNGNQVPLAASQRGPGTYSRASTPHRPVVDCFHSTSAAAGGYMPSAAGGGQSSVQTALRIQQTPQPSAPPAPQQDMSKTTMPGHSFVATQNATPQPRSQYNYQYHRQSQHGTRPSTHQRQQQPFMTGASTATSAPVMYHPVLYPQHMGMQYQPRSSSQGYFSYVTPPYVNYSNPVASHTQYYYPNPNSQPLQTANIQGNASGGRSNPSTPLVGPQGSSATPVAQASSLTHAPTQFSQSIPAVRTTQIQKRRHRVPIINPDTQQEIYVEEAPSADSSGRQTPQTDQQVPVHSAIEEFSRKVNESLNKPSPAESFNKLLKSAEVPITTAPSSQQPQSIITVTSISNNVDKDIVLVNENKNEGSDVAAETNEPPVVSAISDSPVIVPKLQNNKQLQKNSDQLLVIDTSKNVPLIKQNKQNKIKPVVPQNEDLEQVSDIITDAQVVTMTVNSSVNNYTPPIPMPFHMSVPQPQRIREHRSRRKSEEKEKLNDRDSQQHIELPLFSSKPNGPTSNIVISSVDSFQEVINPPTSQYSQITGVDLSKTQATKLTEIPFEIDSDTIHIKVDKGNKPEPTELAVPTPTELLSAGIEKVAKEFPAAPDTFLESNQISRAIQAQVKLTQSLVSCLRTNQPDSKMKDINLNNKSTDSDSANGNSTDVTKIETKEDINKNEKLVKNTKKKSVKMANSDANVTETVSYENGKNETDKVSNIEQEQSLLSSKEEEAVSKPTEIAVTPVVTKFTPKHNYSEDQWSPLNKSGKRCYDLELLKQIKDDPLSKNKPNIPLLETCNIVRSTPTYENMPFAPIQQRPIISDTFMPAFGKGPNLVGVIRSTGPRDVKKDSRNMSLGGKGSMKSSTSQSGNSGAKVIHVVTLSREEVKLNEVDSAWKPSRFRKETLTEDDYKTQDLYKKFRGILNKLTPQKFDTLLEKVKTLNIDTQTRLEGVIDLVFEKAIDEPNFSEAYAAMCNKLSMLKVPADKASAPNQYVNFRALIISKCQNQFVTKKVDEQVLKLEKEKAECNDPNKKKELQLMLEEENRRARMRSVGNVRFIGELYKLKMLTSKIMVYCMNHLIEDVLEEENLECLCKLLTTIGEQVESEAKTQLDSVFEKMQNIIYGRKSNKISSRVRFMIQDVIELRKRRWVVKSVVDSQQQRQIELFNANPMGGFRNRNEGGRGKRGEGRRQNSNSFQMDNSNNWILTKRYTIDTSKSKAVNLTINKKLSTVKLAPPAWSPANSAKTAAQISSNSVVGLTNNKYSVLEMQPNGSSRIKGSTAKATISQENIYAMINLSLNNPVDNQLIQKVKCYGTRKHAAVVTEILNMALERFQKKINTIAKFLLHLVSTNTILSVNFELGIADILDFAPDLYIDIPMIYEYLGVIIAPHIEKRHITLFQVLMISKSIKSAKQGHLLLKTIIRHLTDDMGPIFAKNKWLESNLKFNQWMSEEQIPSWIADNKFEYLEGATTSSEENNKP